jgi:hypothetical protein
VKEAADDYFQGKVSAREVYALFASGELRGFRVGACNGRILIYWASLEAYRRKHEKCRGPDPFGARTRIPTKAYPDSEVPFWPSTDPPEPDAGVDLAFAQKSAIRERFVQPLHRVDEDTNAGPARMTAWGRSPKPCALMKTWR